MQVGEQRPPVADCFHRRSYLFMLSHFQISDMVLFLTHQPFIIQKSTDIHFFCRNTFHGIFPLKSFHIEDIKCLIPCDFAYV